MNRRDKRLLQRQGQLGPDGVTPVRRTEAPRRQTASAAVAAGVPRERFSLRVFLHEVNVEMRKVVRPSREETVNYSTVVLATLILLVALIFGFDFGFEKAAIFLFKG
jgi:preprotein translocase SecE subunit